MNKKLHLAPLVLGVILLCLVYAVFVLYKRQNILYDELVRFETLQTDTVHTDAAPEKISVNDGALLKPETWLDIQKRALNTVVQIFAQVTQVNLIEPYKTPGQSESWGSGFFINDAGHIITNYHVVDDASTIQIQIPSFGREQFDVEVIGVCPDRDIALLKLTDAARVELEARLGKIPFLVLGNSDAVLKTQEILALGYPLGQQIVKSTQGIVSGHEWIMSKSYIQITAPLNPGNSGGPALNKAGEVIGINTAGVPSAQNVGFVIPINEVKSTINDLYKITLLRKPVLGCIFTYATPELVSYLGNPEDGGWYIARVFPNSTLDKAGVKQGDMLYEINGHRVDKYGEIAVPWSEDKVPTMALLNRFVVGDDIHLVIYRKGVRKDFRIKLETRQITPIRQVYPLFEKIDYEIVGGMVIMELTLNHVLLMLERAPFLMSYTKPENQTESRLVLTHLFSNSAAYKTRLISPGALIDEVNGVKVRTLDEFRQAARKPQKKNFFTLRCIDRAHDDILVVLALEKMLQDEDVLASRYFYRKTDLVAELEKVLEGSYGKKNTHAA